MMTYLEMAYPFTGKKQSKLRDFLKNEDLDYDESICFTVNLCNDQEEILATGSRHHSVLKCIAVSKNYQGEGFLNTIMTQLVNNAFEEGISHLFLFTKPSHKEIFQDYGFWPIIENELILLMENKKQGIINDLKKEKALYPISLSQEKVGAIVMNANPFTKGHFYLIQKSLEQCDRLHVFVLENTASDFPPDLRLSLVKEGCKDLNSVYIHGSSDYLISFATFPDYFLKDKQVASQSAGALDLEIFCTYFCPAFEIAIRFIGEEPFCETTQGYNQAMKKILPKHDIEVMEIPRLKSQGIAISASYIRKEFLAGRAFLLKAFLPKPTYDYLNSSDGNKLRDALLKKL